MGVFAGVFDGIFAGEHHRRHQGPTTRQIHQHEGGATPHYGTPRATHEPHPHHAAAAVHIAEHASNPTLASHLLHYAFPTLIPKPTEHLTDSMLHELAAHLDTAIHHVGHPTRPAIVSRTTHAALEAGHGIQGGVVEKAQHGGIKTVAQGAKLKKAVLHEARAAAAGTGNRRTMVGQAAMHKSKRVPTGITSAGYRHYGTRTWKSGEMPGWAKVAADVGLAALPIPGLEEVGAARLLARIAPLLIEGSRGARAVSAIGRGVEASRAGKAAGGVLKAAGGRAGETAIGRGAVATARATTPLVRPAAKGLRYAGRHPVQGAFGASVGAQIPAVAATGDPKQLLKGLEGTGALASLLGTVGKGATEAIPGVGGRALSDLINLPAQVPPSLYLTGKAGAEAIGGNSKDLNALIAGFKKEDPLGALLLAGDPGQALHNLSQHPVYGALEALGLKSAAGHIAGRTARSGALGGAAKEAARTSQRPPIHVYGDVSQHRGPYSRDLIQAMIQKRRDVKAIRKRPGPQVEGIAGGKVSSIRAKPRQASKYLASAVDRAVYGNEQIRRGEQAKLMHELGGVRPADAAQADVVSLLAQRIARSPESAVADLRAYREHLTKSQAELERIASTSADAQERGWARVQLDASRHTAGLIDKALKNPDPQALAVASDAYIRTQAPLTQVLVEKGLLNPAQARKAAQIPFARVHMGAGHGLSHADQALYEQVHQRWSEAPWGSDERNRLFGQMARIRARRQTLTAAGHPLSSEEIAAEMKRQGADTAGFVTQRMGSKGSSAFFRNQAERPRMASQRRTGEATTKGTLDPSWEALVEHAVNTRSVVDTVRSVDALTGRFGIRAPGGHYFGDTHEARIFAEDPAHFGAKLPDVPGGYVPYRVAPWLAKRAELEAAKRDSNPAIAEKATQELQQLDQMTQGDNPEAAQLVMHDTITEALKEGPGDTILIPKTVADRLQAHFQSKYPMEKTIEAATGMFKGAVLPTSPGWATGNIVDNYVVRMFGTGLTPSMIRSGKGFAEIMKQELGPEQAARALESITPGGIFGSYKRIQPHRAYEQFVSATPLLRGIWNAAHRARNAPGLKTVGDLYKAYRDNVFHFDSKYVEQTPQFAELSRTAQHDLGMTRRQFRAAVKEGAPAVRDLARGLRNTDTQVRYAKRVEATFGNWGKSSPEARRFLTTWAPFWMWSRAATKFVFVTMPRDHPIITGLIAASEQMTRPERMKLGFDFNAKKPLPDWAQGAIPLPGGGSLKVSNLTSYGYSGNVVGNLGTLPAPQFSNLLHAMQGLDWKGDQLVRADGGPASELDKAKVALATTAESFVPFLNVGTSVAGGGAAGALPAKIYPKSTTEFLRSLHDMQTISVPTSKGGSSTTNPFDSAFGNSGSSSSSNPFDSAFGGGGSSGSSNPFDKVFK